ncbi:hypothetical protein PHMEG_0001695 [Phytophthora megakarya]|uniref:Uncharacterized protein n=1 Tax=Phytophthora megakarya TaxID=4795 RepID=A0A225X109_9STRA|nr:hypothetical protein PHMEG_0001695 [Phytophthora megakarya]
MAHESTPIAQAQLPLSLQESRRERSSGEWQHYKDNSTRITYGKTWAEDVQIYRTAKSVLPWLPDQQKLVKHVTRYEKSREEREFDPLLGRFREEGKELGLQQRESMELKRNLEKGRAAQLRTIQRFNIINNAPMYPGAQDPTDKQPVTHPYRKKSAADYNIVTNVPYNGTSAPGTSGCPSLKPYREFNILTNKYHDRHDERSEQDAVQAKQIAAEKFCKTRIFDPIRITYTNADREKEFLARRREEEQVHGKDRILLLPSHEQFSEGRLYNILNQRVINSAKLAAMDGKDQRTLNKIKKTAFETKMRELGETQQARDTNICLNRFAHKRHVESQVHGYDVVSNQLYVGRDAKAIAHPRTHASLSAWQTIKTGLLNSNRIAPKSSSAARLSSNQQAVRDTHMTKPNILIVEQDPSIVQVRQASYHRGICANGSFLWHLNSLHRTILC